MAKFAAIVPEPSLAALITETAAELNEDVVVIEAGIEELLQAVRRAESSGAAAIVAKGYLADPVRSLTSLPVVACNPGPLDAVIAIARSKQMGVKVALLHFGGLVLDLDMLGAAMGVELKEFTPGRTSQEVRKTIEEVKAAGFDVVVGGQVTVDMARTHGLKAMAIGIGKVSVRQALEACAELVKSSSEVEERRLRYSEVLDYLPFGVIATDPNGIIRICNRAAVALGAGTPAHVGQPASEALSGSPVLAALKGEHQSAGRVSRIGDTRVLVEAVAWKSEGQNAGALCVLSDVGSAERLVDRLSSPEEVKEEVPRFSFDDIPARSPTMKETVEKARQYSLSDSPVLITGELGTGKEVIAQAIHQASRRRTAFFGRVSCGGLSTEALERRLFGFEKGAFMAARKSVPGVFEVCNGGTVFLDDVGALPLEIQARIVTVMDTGQSWRIGGTEPRTVDVRILASTAKDLRASALSGVFSEGLYWRLAGMSLDVPPLRQRTEDIPDLFEMASLAHLPGGERMRLSQSTIAKLKRHGWPGNLRELEGIVKRLIAAFRSMPLLPAETVERMVIEEIQGPKEESGLPPTIQVIPGTLEDMIQGLINQYDRAFSGNKSEVARRLGISRTTLWKKMKEA